jgi:hypothetical protein
MDGRDTVLAMGSASSFLASMIIFDLEAEYRPVSGAFLFSHFPFGSFEGETKQPGPAGLFYALK